MQNASFDYDTSKWTDYRCNSDDTMADIPELEDYSSVSTSEVSSAIYPETLTVSLIPTFPSLSIYTVDTDFSYFEFNGNAVDYGIMHWNQLYDESLEYLLPYRIHLNDDFLEFPRSMWKIVNDQLYYIHQLELAQSSEESSQNFSQLS